MKWIKIFEKKVMKCNEIGVKCEAESEINMESKFIGFNSKKTVK